jgi:hypothetical protein
MEGDIVELEGIGNCARIKRYGTDYAVEFSPMLKEGGHCDEWGIAEAGPGSLDSTFKTKRQAEIFLNLMKKTDFKKIQDDTGKVQELIRKAQASEMA